MEKKQIFRQKSLERMNTPESLNNYIRVTTPAVWIILIAVILLITGAFVWAASVKLATKTVTGAAVVKNGTAALYLDEEGMDTVAAQMLLIVGEEEFILPELDTRAVRLYELNDAAIMKIIGVTEEEYAYRADFAIDLPNGIYTATIASETRSPLTFLTE